MIYIHSEALKKAKEIVDLANQEITFFGFVIEKGRDLIIRDIHLPKHQKNSSATTLVLKKSYDEMIDVEEELREKYGSGFFRCHIHSHVNMNTFQSSVDEKTFNEFLEDSPYYIAIIMNKKGSITSYVGSYGIKSEFELKEYDPVKSDDYEKYVEIINILEKPIPMAKDFSRAKKSRFPYQKGNTQTYPSKKKKNNKQQNSTYLSNILDYDADEIEESLLGILE